MSKFNKFRGKILMNFKNFVPSEKVHNLMRRKVAIFPLCDRILTFSTEFTPEGLITFLMNVCLHLLSTCHSLVLFHQAGSLYIAGVDM